MSIDPDLNSLEHKKFVESTAHPTFPVVAVANADGTPVASGISVAVTSSATVSGTENVMVNNFPTNFTTVVRNFNSDIKGNIGVGINAGLVPTNTALNTYSVHLTSNATTTVTSSLAYIADIVVSVATVGTTSTVTIQDKSGTPLKLVAGLSTASALTAGNDSYSYSTPIQMVGGIDIVTAGAAAATVDVFINYYQ